MFVYYCFDDLEESNSKVVRRSKEESTNISKHEESSGSVRKLHMVSEGSRKPQEASGRLRNKNKNQTHKILGF